MSDRRPLEVAAMVVTFPGLWDEYIEREVLVIISMTRLPAEIQMFSEFVVLLKYRVQRYGLLKCARFYLDKIDIFIAYDKTEWCADTSLKRGIATCPAGFWDCRNLQVIVARFPDIHE